MTEGRDFPYRGWLVWLTQDQGGRSTGPPLPRADWPHYAATAFVPPRTVETGLASFVLRDFQEGAWRSKARGRWLVVDGVGDQEVRPGTVVVVTEGARPVAYFTVDEVDG